MEERGVLPSEGLKRCIRRVDSRSNADKAHQCIAVIAWEILVCSALVKAFECESHELDLAQDQIAFVVVNEL